MSLKRIILEMGTGNDLYGEDYTKAAVRAVRDALQHSSLPLFHSLGIDARSMQVVVSIGVQQPERVDTETVAAVIPYGSVRVEVRLGGLNVHDPDNAGLSVVATAAVAASIDTPDRRYTVGS